MINYKLLMHLVGLNTDLNRCREKIILYKFYYIEYLGIFKGYLHSECGYILKIKKAPEKQRLF
jgi:hypothetical protein|tara:strand:- start:312 stop:500 length:189 start_codon:yes stop_codon:yes gene_type:complete